MVSKDEKPKEVPLTPHLFWPFEKIFSRYLQSTTVLFLNHSVLPIFFHHSWLLYRLFAPVSAANGVQKLKAVTTKPVVRMKWKISFRHFPGLFKTFWIRWFCLHAWIIYDVVPTLLPFLDGVQVSSISFSTHFYPQCPALIAWKVFHG